MKKLKKHELISLVNSIERVLTTSLNEAHPKSLEYSNDIMSQKCFEIGYLGGAITTVLDYIKK